MLSIAIPSRTERFLKNTIEDVLKNATGEIEVFPILDGYDPPANEIVRDPRVKYLRLPKASHMQKRHGINIMAILSQGKYLMSLDAHCMVAEGFDEVLAQNHQENWIQIPRRNRLNAEKWCLQEQGDGRPPIDYEYFMWQGFTALGNNRLGLHGYKWDARTKERWNILIDDTMEFQGSCWFMTKDWYKKMGFMNIDRYGGWGQEAEELGLTTWQNGGRVVTNKKTWYAHLHKGKAYGRMYFMNKTEVRASHAASFDFWVHQNKKFFIKYIEKFWPVPRWPENWKEVIYG